MNTNKLINRKRVVKTITCVLIAIGIVAAMTLLVVELIGASHLAALINHMCLN